MLETLLDGLRAAPDRFTTRARGLGRRAKARASAARDEGRTRWLEARTDALQRTAALLDAPVVAKADALPGVGKVTGAAARLVHRQLDRLTAPPIDGFESMNAKDAIAAAKLVTDRVALRQLHQFELAHKARKTVLAALEGQLA